MLSAQILNQIVAQKSSYKLVMTRTQNGHLTGLNEHSVIHKYFVLIYVVAVIEEGRLLQGLDGLLQIETEYNTLYTEYQNGLTF